MNDREAIDRVLEALREAKAPAGMEARILRKLEQQVDVQATRRRGLAALQPSRVAAAGIAVTLAFFVSWRLHQEHAIQPAGVMRHEAAALQSWKEAPAPATLHRESPPTSLQSNGEHTSSHNTMPAAQINASKPDQSRLQHASPLTANPRSGRSRAPERTAEDAATLRETRAASHPAPELPLTEQERLLLRLAHRNDRSDPEVLAVLNPVLRGRESQEERVEFEVFFASPATQDEQQQPITDKRGNTR